MMAVYRLFYVTKSYPGLTYAVISVDSKGVPYWDILPEGVEPANLSWFQVVGILAYQLAGDWNTGGMPYECSYRIETLHL